MKLLDFEEDMAGFGFPRRDCCQVLLLFAGWDLNRACINIPCETCEQGVGAKGGVFGCLPGCAQLVREKIDVVQAVRKSGIFRRARRSLGEVEDGEGTVFVIFLWLVIWEGGAAVPLSATISAGTTFVSYALGPDSPLSIVLLTVFTEDAEKQVVINPFGKGANPFTAEDIGTCICEASIRAGC